MKLKLVKGKQKLPRPLRIVQTELGRVEKSKNQVSVVIPAGIYLPPDPANPVSGVSVFAEARIGFYDPNEELEEGVTKEDAIESAAVEACEWLNDFDKGVRGFKKWPIATK